MLIDLVIEGFTEGNHVALILSFDSAVVEAIRLEAEESEHLRDALKADDPAFLFQGERCNPNRDEPILTEGQTVVGVAEYLKEKFAAVPRVCELIFQWAAQGQTAQNEMAGR